MEDTPSVQEATPDEKGQAPRLRLRRAIKLGCLTMLVGVCACMGTLLVALQSGPVSLSLLGASVHIGSDDFVLSNYSFRDGTTYYLDLNVGGARNILEFRRMKGDPSLHVVLHHADRQSQGDTHLLTLPMP